MQGIDQVGHVFSAPFHHLVSTDAGVSAGCEPLLQEHDLGVMIRSFGEDAATPSPGRDHVEGNTETWNI
jgi:hypothetical protein